MTDLLLPPAPVDFKPRVDAPVEPVQTPIVETYVPPLKSAAPLVDAAPASASILVSPEKHAKRPVTDARVGRAILYYAQQKNARKLGIR